LKEEASPKPLQGRGLLEKQPGHFSYVLEINFRIK